MMGKFIVLLFGVLSFAVILHGLSLDLGKQELYFTCYNYATCDTDGPAHQKQHYCISNVTSQDLEMLYQYVLDNGFYDFTAETEPGAVQEYCQLEGEEQVQAFGAIVKGLIGYVINVCAEPDQQDQCTRFKKGFSCLFPLLEEFRAEGLC